MMFFVLIVVIFNLSAIGDGNRTCSSCSSDFSFASLFHLSCFSEGMWILIRVDQMVCSSVFAEMVLILGVSKGHLFGGASYMEFQLEFPI